MSLYCSHIILVAMALESLSLLQEFSCLSSFIYIALELLIKYSDIHHLGHTMSGFGQVIHVFKKQ